MKIFCYPSDVLRKPGEEVARFDDELADVARRMFETMYTASGVGLAAPQVGLSIRMCVLNAEGTPEGERVLVNPRIVERTDTVTGDEGCLSFPGIFIKVQRSARITVRYQDLTGAEQTLEADGLFARAVQHEIDHLDGVLLVDKMTRVQQMANRRALKMLELRHAGTGDAFVG